MEQKKSDFGIFFMDRDSLNQVISRHLVIRKEEEFPSIILDL